MRMERMLADLEAAADALAQAEARAEVAESVRAESGRVGLVDRLRAVLGRQVSVTMGGVVVTGTLLDVGEGWVALDRRARGVLPNGLDEIIRPGVAIVPVDAIGAVVGLGRAHVPDTDSAIGRTWGSLLRAVARSRVPVGWHVDGRGEPYVGRIEAVGADHVMLRTSGSAEVTVAVTTSALAWLDLCAPSDG